MSTKKGVMEIDIDTGAAILTVVSKKYGAFRVLLDASDYPRVATHKWCVLKSKKNTLTYFGANLLMSDGKRKTLLLHRFLMDPPKGLLVDHKDAYDTLDNRRSNLRIATREQNNQNKRPRTGTSSQYKGVSWTKLRGKWSAYITKSGRTLPLGCCDCEMEAAKLYDAAAIDLFGEFALLNFPISAVA